MLVKFLYLTFSSVPPIKYYSINFNSYLFEEIVIKSVTLIYITMEKGICSQGYKNVPLMK